MAYQGHECQWNGPSWPLATAVTLTALANVLNSYSQDAVGAGVSTVRPASLVFACSIDNDLYRVSSENGMEVRRFDAPETAVAAAGEGDGVLLLADGYPAKTTPFDAALFAQLARQAKAGVPRRPQTRLMGPPKPRGGCIARPVPSLCDSPGAA